MMDTTTYSINGRTIKVGPHSYWGHLYVAYDDNSYDGAPDGDTRSGEGKTHFEAIDDLLIQYDEEMNEEDALQFEDSPAWKAANGAFGVGA